MYAFKFVYNGDLSLTLLALFTITTKCMSFLQQEEFCIEQIFSMQCFVYIVLFFIFWFCGLLSLDSHDILSCNCSARSIHSYVYSVDL